MTGETPEVRSDKRYPKDILKISQRYLKDIPKISPRYPKDIPKIYPRYHQDIPALFARIISACQPQPIDSIASKALNRIFCWSFDNIDIEEKNVVKID